MHRDLSLCQRHKRSDANQTWVAWVLWERRNFRLACHRREPREATRCSHRPWSRRPEYQKTKKAINKYILGIWCILTDIQTLAQLAQKSGCPPLEMLKDRSDDPVKQCPCPQQWGWTRWSLKVFSNPNKVINFMISYFSIESLKFPGSDSLNCH